MEQNFATHCDREFSWDPNRPLVVACSGGLDSVVLTHLMHNYHGNLILAHMNYGLRGVDSDQDEAFVAALGAELGHEVVIERVDPNSVKNEAGMSLQMKARELRYAFFEHVMLSRNAQGVLTAHHADDNLETFLINLSRSTGLKGLTGIKSIARDLYRPLLPFKRSEILAFAQNRAYTWREDLSNQTDDYQRNIIRHHISPGFDKLERPWDQSLRQTQEYLDQAQTLLQDYLDQVSAQVITQTEDGLCLDLKALSAYPNANVLLAGLCREYGLKAGQDVGQLAQAQSGARIYTQTHELLKDRGVILINALAHQKEVNQEHNQIDKTNAFNQDEVSQELDHRDQWFILDKEGRQTGPQQSPVNFSFEQVEGLADAGPNVIFVPTQMLVFPLRLRRWQNGDVFYPFGGPGKKKISKYFKDERLSLVRKNKIWLLECENRIMWVVGLRADERFRVTDQCPEITKITWLEGD
ncbi:tRNA lysidine(34) synthetase TilS [Flavobacteriaceae bacterium]|nr:tRNA lysidine(34) synthetase TilS [Flavobacteriaceae bacterium]